MSPHHNVKIRPELRSSIEGTIARINAQIILAAENYPHLKDSVCHGTLPIVLSVRDAGAIVAFLDSVGIKAGNIAHSVPPKTSLLHIGSN